MKRIALTLLLLCLLVGAQLPALAQSPELMAAYRQYKMLDAQGKYAEALRLLCETLSIHESTFSACGILSLGSAPSVGAECVDAASSKSRSRGDDDAAMMSSPTGSSGPPSASSTSPSSVITWTSASPVSTVRVVARDDSRELA